MCHPHRALLAVSILCLLAVPTAAPAQEPRTAHLTSDAEPEDEAPLEKRLDLRLSVGVEYDDNILHLRDDAITEFESGVFDPDRFLISSAEDAIFSPRLDLTYSLTPETRRKTRFGITAAAFLYGDNSIKDYERYQLRFERDISDTRPDMRDLELTTEDLRSTRFRVRRAFLGANRSRLRLSYSFTPERYLGQLFDDDAGVRASSQVESESWEVRYVQRLDRGEESRWSLLLGLRRDDHDYNADFDERDAETDRFKIGLNRFSLAENAFWLTGVAFEYAERRSNTALIGRQGPGGTIQDDLSYDGEVLILKLGRFWYRMKDGRSLYKSSGFLLELEIGNKDYITGNELDLSHFGRDDDYRSLLVALNHPVNNHWVVHLWGEYRRQETNLDPLSGFDRLEPSDFENVVFGIRLSYYASKKSSRSTAPRRP